VLPENAAAFAVLRSVFPVRFVRRDRDATELVCLVVDERHADRAA